MTTPEPRGSGVGAIIAAALIGSFAAGLTVVLQILGWGADQVLLLLGFQVSWLVGPAVSLVNAVLVAAPALLLARFAQSPSVRATGRAWVAGAVALAALGTVRMVPAAEPELALAVLAAVAAMLTWLLRRRPRPAPRRPAPGAYPVAAATGTAVLLPWLWVGALGGVLETLLALVAAATVGRLAATVLDGRFWRHFAATRARLTAVGGLVAGVTLVLIAAGTGAPGAQLPLMAVLPPLGFAAAALAPHGWALTFAGDDPPPAGMCRAHWLLFGLAVAGPLALVDPEEITLVLAGRDVPFWTAVAAGGGLLLALLFGLAWAVLRPGRFRWRRWTSLTVAGALVTAGAAVHLAAGQPGVHGERLFVLMAEQADLTGLPVGVGQAGRDARAAEVYRRLVAHAEASQADLRSDLDRVGLAYRPYYLVNALEVSGGPVVRAWLSGRDDVDRVLRSQRLRPLPALPAADRGTPGLTPRDPEWNVAAVGADRVWSLGITGEEIVVGGSDSGVDAAHPALAEGYRGGDYSWYDPWHGTTAPLDYAGHGTHTMGSALGRGGIGVAPGAEWTGCVNLARNGGNPAYYLDCLQFMLAPFPPGGDPWRDGRPEYAPHVLTNSWGCPPIEGCDADTLRSATAALSAAGIYVVAAAGNAGPFCGSIEDPPAPYPDVLTVGAVGPGGELALFSSRGPVPGAAKPDLVAPGEGVVSAAPGGGYATSSGTSMAAPQVAGVVALMWSADPELVGDLTATTSILRSTARPVAVDDSACGGAASLVGAGLVDAEAAVSAVLDR